MNEIIEELISKLEKSRSEFDIATTCVAHSLQSICERLDKVELWMIEDQKKPMIS